MTHFFIVDEANVVLGLGKGREATSSTMRKIVQLTKESKKLTAITASSDYGYPHKLENDNELNLNDTRRILFAGEIPPKSMWDLLVTKKKSQSTKAVIGMGDNLAHLLMASYVGHFYRILGAVASVLHNKEKFSIQEEFNPPIKQGITNSFKVKPRKSRKLTNQIAKFGFASVKDYQDTAVQLIAKENLAGAVSPERAQIVSLPSDIYLGIDYFALVPTSQSARLVFARYVLLNRRGWRRLMFWSRN